MNLSNFQKMDPNLLIGLVNTALRNDADDLDDLVKQHNLDREALEARLAEVEYRYDESTKQFR